MPYVAPSTVVAGQTYSAANHNIIVNDIIDHETRVNTLANQPGVQAYRTTDLSAYASGTDITWTNEANDTDSMWTASAPTLITINTAGIYMLTLTAHLNATATLTYATLAMFIASTPIASIGTPPESSTDWKGTVSTLMSLSAGQTVAGRIYVTGGSNYVIKGTSSLRNSSASRLIAKRISD